MTINSYSDFVLFLLAIGIAGIVYFMAAHKLINFLLG